MKNRQIAFITQTAVMLALLVGAQFITRSFGQFVTGALVNLILLVSIFTVGLGGGLTVAVVSPFLAFMVGIGPAFIQVVPFVAVGNAILVITAYVVRNHIVRKSLKGKAITALGLIAASSAKTLFLWIGLVIIALPLIPGINEKQITVISAAFSWPQLITALVGSALAMVVTPLLKTAIKSGKECENYGKENH